MYTKDDNEAKDDGHYATTGAEHMERNGWGIVDTLKCSILKSDKEAEHDVVVNPSKLNIKRHGDHVEHPLAKVC